MRVKLLDTDLIRTFGSVVIDMEDLQGKRYVNNGKAINLDNGKTENKSLEYPNADKNIWVPPEKKMFKESNKVDLNFVYPKVNDFLFEQIGI